MRRRWLDDHPGCSGLVLMDLLANVVQIEDSWQLQSVRGEADGMNPEVGEVADNLEVHVVCDVCIVQCEVEYVGSLL